MPAAAGGDECGVAGAVLKVQARRAGEQHLGDLLVACCCGDEQRRVAEEAAPIDERSGGEQRLEDRRIGLRGRGMQGRETARIDGVGPCAGAEQRRHGLPGAHGRRVPQRRTVQIVFRIDLRAARDQQAHNGRLAPGRCKHQRRVTFAVGRVEVAPSLGLADAIVDITETGETLRATAVSLLRQGERNAWLEVTLDEGRNRHIRRLLASLGFDVRRLLRTAIGELRLGELAKGQWRHLSDAEVAALRRR